MVWSGANQAHGYATLSVARELEKNHVRAQRLRHDHEHGRHVLEVLERHNEESAVGMDATVLWREASDVHDVCCNERGGKDIERNDCSVCDDAQHNRGSFQGRTLLVDLLACEPGDGSLGCVQFVRAQGQGHPKVQKVRDISTNADTLGVGRLGCGATKLLGSWVREASQKVVPAKHTPSTSE